MKKNQFVACHDEVARGRDSVMGQIGNLTKPPGKVIVFHGRQGLHGMLKEEIRNQNGYGRRRNRG